MDPEVESDEEVGKPEPGFQSVTEKDAKKEPPKAEPEKAPAVTMEMIEGMRSENAQLKELAAKAQRDAAASQEYAQRIISEIQIASQRGGGGNGEAPDLRDQLNENPEAALDQHFYTRMRPLIEQNLGYQVQTARALFEDRHRNDEDYKEYKGELEEFMKSIPPEVKANPAAWDNAMKFVIANHLDEVMQRRSKKQNVVETRAFVEPPSGISNRTPEKKSLNDDQKAIAKGLGLTEDEYREFLV